MWCVCVLYLMENRIFVTRNFRFLLTIRTQKSTNLMKINRWNVYIYIYILMNLNNNLRQRFIICGLKLICILNSDWNENVVWYVLFCIGWNMRLNSNVYSDLGCPESFSKIWSRYSMCDIKQKYKYVSFFQHPIYLTNWKCRLGNNIRFYIVRTIIL